MPTKKNIKKIREEILDCYLNGMRQSQILEKFEGQLKNNNLKTLVYESEFLAPKNFRLGACLLFIITLVTPALSAYLRGYIYKDIIDILFVISVLFAIPYAFFGLFFFKTKDIKKLRFLALAFLFYQLIVIITYILISIDLKLWTLSLFSIILFPTFVSEFFKLKRLEFKMETRKKG